MGFKKARMSLLKLLRMKALKNTEKTISLLQFIRKIIILKNVKLKAEKIFL